MVSADTALLDLQQAQQERDQAEAQCDALRLERDIWRQQVATAMNHQGELLVCEEIEISNACKLAQLAQESAVLLQEDIARSKAIIARQSKEQV